MGVGVARASMWGRRREGMVRPSNRIIRFGFGSYPFGSGLVRVGSSGGGC